MSVREISVIADKGKDSERSLRVQTEAIGENFDEALDLNGKEVLFARYAADAVVGFQGYIRGLLKATNKETGEFVNTDEDILEKAATWVPSAKQGRTADPLGKLEKSIEALAASDPEGLKALLQKAGLAPVEEDE